MKKINLQKLSNKELDEAFTNAKGRIRKGSVRDKILTEMKKRGKGSLLNFRV